MGVEEYYDYTPRKSQAFGAPRDNGNRSHRGVDISHSTKPGTPVPSLIDGYVIAKKSPDSSHGFGFQVTIREYDSNRIWSFAHGNERSPLAIGQDVRVGDIVITEGRTGATNGSCVHIELNQNGQYVDPMPVIDQIIGEPKQEDEEMATIVNVQGAAGKRNGGAHVLTDGKAVFLGASAKDAPTLDYDAGTQLFKLFPQTFI